MAFNQISTNHKHAGSRADKQIPDANETKQLERVKAVFRDPLTFILLVWGVMIAVAGVCWILSR